MLSLLLSLSASAAQATPSITVDTRKPTIEVSKSLFGIFFEEINQAGEGGIYGELLRNRGFEFEGSATMPVGWKSLKGSPVSLDRAVKLNDARRASLRLDGRNGITAVANEGFWGIPVTAGERYRLQLWTKSDQPVTASITAAGGTVATATFPTSADWKLHEVELAANRSDPKAALEVSVAAGGVAHIGYASLMSEKSIRNNGFRADLIEKLSAMRPAFLRFPGGCFVEGDTLSIRWNWKDSLGPIESRVGMPRIHWGYPSSNGLGYHEYLLLCEQLGSEAMFVANVGMSHREVVPMSEMGPYVQEALDAIEYAMGPVSSKWGALRAKNGHPQPFKLKYVQIGNENGGPAYNERFKLFSEAIHAKYPQIERIACLWGSKPTSAPYELIDEHYYDNPSWFWANSNRYDSYPRNGEDVYVGEYAVTRGSGRGNLAGALSEAAFMAGMERNSDIVKLASYAPLFENVNNRQWNPNAILFDASQSYGTPSYWVQTLYGQNRVDRILAHKVTAPKAEIPPMGGGIGLMTWRTDAEFKDIQLTVDGKRINEPIRIHQTSGAWTHNDGIIRQTTIQDNRQAHLQGLSTVGAKRMSLQLKAKKNSGDEGFIIMFEVGSRTLQWNLGGWENTVHAFQVNGGRTGRGVPAKIDTGKWYDIRIEQTADRIRGYLDGKLVEEVRIQPVPDFTAVAGVDEKANEVVVRIVNGASASRRVNLNLNGIKANTSARATVLKGSTPDDENSFAEPNKVSPMTSRLTVGPKSTYTAPPYSLTILRIPR